MTNDAQSLHQAKIMLETQAAEIKRLRAALRWYGEQVEGCRKLGSIGDPFRHALDKDGGFIARAALKVGS